MADDKRDTSTNGGNYNEKIKGSYFQGGKKEDNSDHSVHVTNNNSSADNRLAVLVVFALFAVFGLVIFSLNSNSEAPSGLDPSPTTLPTAVPSVSPSPTVSPPENPPASPLSEKPKQETTGVEGGTDTNSHLPDSSTQKQIQETPQQNGFSTTGDSYGKPDGGGTSSVPKQQKSSFSLEINVVEEKGFTFQLQNCTVAQGASPPFTCELLIHNSHNSEKKLEFYASASRRSFSRVIDFRGNEILASFTQLGSSSSDRAAQAYFSKGVPMRAKVSFEAAPEGGVSVVDLGFYLYGNGGGSFRVPFR